MMFTNRNKMIVAMILAAVVAFTAYTMYAKSCACKAKKVAVATTDSPSKKPVLGGAVAVVKPAAEKNAVVSAETAVPKPVLAI